MPRSLSDERDPIALGVSEIDCVLLLEAFAF